LAVRSAMNTQSRSAGCTIGICTLTAMKPRGGPGSASIPCPSRSNSGGDRDCRNRSPSGQRTKVGKGHDETSANHPLWPQPQRIKTRPLLQSAREGLASPARARPRHTQHSPGAQAGLQLAAQRTSTLNEQRSIDSARLTRVISYPGEVTDRRRAICSGQSVAIAGDSVVTPTSFLGHDPAEKRGPTRSHDDSANRSSTYVGNAALRASFARLAASSPLGVPLRCLRGVAPQLPGDRRCRSPKPEGTREFRKVGGMSPPMFGLSAKPLLGRYLWFAEREEIALLRVHSYSMQEAGRRDVALLTQRWFSRRRRAVPPAQMLQQSRIHPSSFGPSSTPIIS
jgi:hypothetical protein